MSIEKNLWQYKQNRPILIARDLEEYGVPKEVTMEILLKRGVFKWLAVRRELIKLKNRWKDEIRALNRRKTEREKGYLEALIKCREEIRKLCHSERLQAPDNDRHAIGFIKEFRIEEDGNGKKDYVTLPS